METLKQMQVNLFENNISQNKEALELLNRENNISDDVNIFTEFEKVESAIKNRESTQLESISYDVWYYNWYETAIMRIHDHFWNIASANESMWEDWKTYTAQDIEDMLKHLLSN